MHCWDAGGGRYGRATDDARHEVRGPLLPQQSSIPSASRAAERGRGYRTNGWSDAVPAVDTPAVSAARRHTHGTTLSDT